MFRFSAAALCVCAFVFSSWLGTLQAEIIAFDTELLSLNLTGPTVGLPLASDPGNALDDSISGYGFVNSSVSITLSSQRSVSPGPRSLGQAIARLGIGETAVQLPPLEPIDPDALDGQIFFVQSFFDVFFDITVTDVDGRLGRDFAGAPDGATIVLQDIGPANMQNLYSVVFDKNAPNFGLIPPPEAAPYIGHFNIEIPLGGDINGNGEDDKIKFTLASHAAGDANRTFVILPDGTVIDNFDSTANLDGAVVDISTDPPFTLSLAGPTTASSILLNPSAVPEPSSLMVGSLLGLGLLARRRFGARRSPT